MPIPASRRKRAWPPRAIIIRAPSDSHFLAMSRLSSYVWVRMTSISSSAPACFAASFAMLIMSSLLTKRAISFIQFSISAG